MTWRSVWFAVSVSILGLSFAGCGDENDVEVHTPIWGYVTGPDGPLRARVSAWAEYPTFAYAYTGADGRYELPVAPGIYAFSVEVENVSPIYYLADGSFGLPGEGRRAGQVEVEPLADPVRIDVHLPSAQVSVEGLDYWEDREIGVAFGGAAARARVLGGTVAADFPVVAPGDHTLELEEALVPGTYRADEALRFQVAEGERAVIDAAMTVEPTLVHGMLEDPLGVKRIVQCETPEGLFYAEADSTGRFSIELWSDRATFRMSPYGPPFGLSERMDGVADEFALVSGETLEVPAFVLPGVRIVPAGSFSEEIRFWIRESPTDSVRVWWGSGPPYLLGPLPVGRYLVGAEQGWPCYLDWIPTECESWESCDALTVEVSAESPFPTISFPLRTGAAIEGVLTGVDPWFIREVRLWRDGESVCGTNPLYGDGVFTISGLRPGSYRVQIRHDDGTSVWYPGVRSEKEAGLVEIREEGERVFIDVIWP